MTNTNLFQRLTVEGGGYRKDTERMLLSADLSLTTDQASEMSFALNDPNWAFIESFKGDRGPIGKKAMYGTSMPLFVSSFSLDGGPSGLGGTTLKLQPGGIGRARNIKGALNRQNISATQYAKDAAAHCGMKFIGQDTKKRPSIARDVASKEDKNAEANEWTTLKRLAGEEGYLLYESLNTLYFATPQWLFDKQPTITVGWGTSVSNDIFRLMDLPDIEMSTSQKTDDTISFTLPIEAAGKIMPGNGILVKGIFKAMSDKKMLVTEVSYPLAGLGDVQVKARYPWKVEKQEAGSTGAKRPGGGTGAGSGLAGNTDGERACNACLKWVGKAPYAWGGGGYNGPTRGIRDGGYADQMGDYNKVGFDCSGLMQYGWYQGSRGRVKLPRVTYSQKNAGPQIPAGNARPGDLLLSNGDGHVGMYIGGGKMVEAQMSGTMVMVSKMRASYAVRIT